VASIGGGNYSDLVGMFSLLYVSATTLQWKDGIKDMVFSDLILFPSRKDASGTTCLSGVLCCCRV